MLAASCLKQNAKPIMGNESFGQLKSKPISSSFPKEAVDFTPWLADEDTINQYLGPVLNLSFTNVRTEVAVDESRIDILAQDEEGNKIIVENQYGKTDHDHLGKLITYASGVEAKYVVWITEQSKQNHQKAVEWLNDNVGDDMHFFLLEAEILQIDDSKPVPRFNVVVEPNDWSKASKSIVRNDPYAEANYAFWSRLRQVASSRPGSQVGWLSPTRRYYMITSIPIRGAHIAAIKTSRNKGQIEQRKYKIGMEFYIPNNKDIFDQLYDKKEKIETELGYQLDWQRLDDKKASRILFLEDSPETGDAEIDWFIKRAEEFNSAFGKHSD